MIGEVETPSTVSEDEGAQWKEYSILSSSFYLYIPEDCISQAKRILDSQAIQCTGLRTYVFDSNGRIVVRNVE